MTPVPRTAPPTRRQALALGAALALAACAPGQGFAPATGGGRAALLLPLSGRHGALGQTMARAAGLAQAEDDPLDLTVLDTASTAEGAAAAATRGRDGGARLILGPVHGPETLAALAALGQGAALGEGVPLLSLSNDASLTGQGAFVFGLTPRQSIGTVLRYAQGQGVRRVGVVTEPTALGRQAAQAAAAVAAQINMSLIAVEAAPGADPTARLRAAAPEAVLLPHGGPGLGRLARPLAALGLQLLGTEQWLGGDPGADPALSGAWVAAPDPAAFAPFAQALGPAAGVLAGLAHDAVGVARALAAAGALGRDGLTRAQGFPGVLGATRIAPDGTTARDLAVLLIDRGRLRLIARPAAA